jgi:hypothetical protein
MKILCLDRNRPFRPRTCKEELLQATSYKLRLVKPEWWVSPLAQEKYHGRKKTCDERT